MKKILLATFILLPVFINAQQIEPEKHALVIGNGAYVNLGTLANPVNDAEDIGVVLTALGFNVESVLNGNLDQMEDAITRLKERLSKDNKSYGFFFYAGHGVQSNGENYLIPVNANIQSESYLRSRAVSVQAMLDELNDANNGLNVIVLDACRDNPFGWSRGGGRGLAIVNSQPADSIIVYATSAGQQASDGDGRNGLFTTHLLTNLLTPGLDVSEVFRLTGLDVTEASKRQQVPAIYNQFFGRAFLGEIPEGMELTFRAAPRPMGPRGSYEFSREQEARFWSIGASAGSSFGEPWVVGTIRGTLAPFKYQFLEAGLNVGMITTRKGATSYYSLMPYARYSFFWPFNGMASGYFGVGSGYSMSQYEYYGFDISVSSLPVDAAVGVLLLDFLDVSFSMSYPVWTASNSETNVGKSLLSNVSNKLISKFAVGYSFRFR